VTDISSKGSLPQLTDLLYLLTDSQELLLLKIQSMRTEIARSTRSEAVPTTANVVNVTPSIGLEGVSKDETAAPAKREMKASASQSSSVTSAAPVVTVLPPLDDPTTETATLITTQTLGSDLAGSSPSITNSAADRNYNFFDDLDERLADLEGPDTAS
jgi:hypothetical protein